MKFPVSRILLKWHQPGLDRPNATDIFRMYDIEKHDSDVVNDEAWSFWQKQVKRYEGSTLIKMETRYIGMFEWCVGWFNHWTFLKDRSDEELLASFRNHVEEVERFNWKAMAEGAKYESWCLMGAEERGRWEGPCHCVHCSQSNVTRMTH
ncbi:MAG: hypothetical protein IH843_05110 [Thaumarchaeota archaeon]|nr:hypothetical protein [Nitrososphaerota archaeon]